MRSRRVVAPAVAAAAVVLTLAGCSAGTGTASGSSGSTSTSTPPSVPPSGAAAPATSGATPAGTVIEVEYVGGRVTGVDQRVAVRLGEQVVLRVTSDVVEEVHVHGYDVDVDLQPGVPAEATFPADKPGTWEVELHDAGRPLFSLRVA